MRRGWRGSEWDHQQGRLKGSDGKMGYRMWLFGATIPFCKELGSLLLDFSVKVIMMTTIN